MKILPAAILLLPSVLLAATVNVGDFANHGLDDWQRRSFQGETDYELVDVDGEQVLKAESRAAASGLYRKQTIDLTRTPWLNWRWKVKNTLGDINERSKSGDDYPARVYVVFSGGVAFWRTRTVVYVWSSNQPVGSEWKNAYTDHARVIALQSGDGKAGQWIAEKRDVREDYRRLFGEDVEEADAVAIMTDTDNTGGSATAWYADIRFTDK